LISPKHAICVLAALLLSVSALPASASTVLYRTDAELIQLSERVVHARALRQRTERPVPGGPIYTVTTLAVLEDLTGVPGDIVEVWELGGVHGGEGMFVGGGVEYRIGADVLVCLERGRRGLRSVAMGFSKFDVAATAGRDGLLSRNLASVEVVGGVPQTRERSLAEFRALVTQVRGAQAIVNVSAAAMRPDDQPRFTTLSSSNPRWFEADSGTPVVWYQNLAFGSSPLTSGDVVAEIQTALAAWTNPPTASIILQYSGTTTQTNPSGPWSGIPSNAGVISWEDPEGDISGSTLAVGGGFFFSNAGTINGVTYGRFTRGYVHFREAAELSSGFRQAPNFTRVLEHEIGHTIGFGHTSVGSTTTSSGSTVNPNIMFASCCNASTPIPPAIGPDDLDGLNTLYPSGSTPPPACTFSISPASATAVAAGGAASVAVTASASTCAWTATVSTATFATITAGSSGTGSGTVSYSVSANTSTSSRSGTLSVAGQTFTITQTGVPANCTYAISPASATVSGAASSVSVSVVSGTGCPWSVVNNSSFLSVAAGSTGSGNGTVTLAVAHNTTTAARSGTATIGGQTFTVTQGTLPSMTIDRAALNFGAVHTGTSLSSQTPAQSVRLTQTGTQNAVTWTAVSNVPWLTVTPASGTGAASLSVAIQFASSLALPPATTTLTNIGAVTITYTGSATTTSTIAATLRLPGTSAPPAGIVDTPVAGTTGLQGSLAVSGWALDDVGIERVEIWRDLQPGETTPPFASPSPGDPRTGKVFIANATFVDGARPDVEAANPTAPLGYRGGWGYLLLTWGLFNQGNGTYTLYAFAIDKEAKLATIGQRAIGVSNAAANKPFGSIDTPAIGGTASGTAVNFGWGLTPKVNGVATCKIPATGVQVSIDSGPLQPVNFGANRTDIGGAFPGFANSDTAGGSFVFDTTALANGLHTIGWLITDDCGRADGVGSRFFTVQNATQMAAEAYSGADFGLKAEATGEHDGAVLVSRGYGELPVLAGPDAAGERRVRVTPGERIELRLPRGFADAHQVVNGERRALPIGASWDPAAQIFAWQPAAGFLGEFVLMFADGAETIRVVVEISRD
jgi:hypothetical protein